MSKINNKNLKSINEYHRKQKDNRESPNFTMNNWKKMHGEVKNCIVRQRKASYGCVKHR